MTARAGAHRAGLGPARQGYEQAEMPPGGLFDLWSFAEYQGEKDHLRIVHF